MVAVLVLLFWHLPYQSEAKLLIKYVKETKPPDQIAADSQVTSPDSREARTLSIPKLKFSPVRTWPGTWLNH